MSTGAIPAAEANVARARVYFEGPDGLVCWEFEDQAEAYRCWLEFSPGSRVAFRAAGETLPVEPWDLVDRPV